MITTTDQARPVIIVESDHAAIALTADAGLWRIARDAEGEPIAAKLCSHPKLGPAQAQREARARQQGGD